MASGVLIGARARQMLLAPLLTSVRAINASQDAYQAITELGDAAKQLGIARLDAIVRRLQPIQTNLQNDIAACNITTKVSASAPSTSPTTR